MTNYEKHLPTLFTYDEDRQRVLNLIAYFHARDYTYKEAHRIMELANSTMQRAATNEKV